MNMCYSDCPHETMYEIRSKWRKARKKPVEIEFREVKGKKETIKTREGELVAIKHRDFVIRGIEGELYPITKSTFYKTYDVLDANEKVKT